MKNFIFLFFIGVFLFGCGSEPEVEKPEEKGPLLITINNEVFNYYPTDFIIRSVNSGSPDIMIVGFHYFKEKSNANAYGIVFGFSDNKFVEASLNYVKENGKVYRTADFNPSETFTIKNFQFDESTKKVSFEYEGKMYESSDNVNTSSKTITVKGKVETIISDINQITGIPLPWAKFTTGSYTFSTVRSISMSEGEPLVLYMNYFTHEGHRLQLALDYTLSALTFPITYTFDVDATTNNLTYMKFIGEPRATTPDIIQAKDWKTYLTKGTLTLNKVAPDHYEGIFSVEVYDGTTLLYKADNGTIIYTPKRNYPGW